MVLILSQKPDEGKQKLKLVHAKGKYTMKGLNSLCLSLKIIKPGRISAKSLVLNQLQNWIIEGVLKPNEKLMMGNWLRH